MIAKRNPIKKGSTHENYKKYCKLAELPDARKCNEK